MPRYYPFVAIGYVIFAPCWVKVKSMRDFDSKWLNRLAIFGIIVGLTIFVYGVYLLAEAA